MNKLYPKKKNQLIISLSLRSASAFILFVLVSLLATGCNMLGESPKYEFSEGFYRVKLHDDMPTRRMYVDPLEEDSLVLYPVRPSAQGPVLDSLNKVVLNTSQERDDPLQEHYTFATPSFDIDLLTIPFKYRPGTSGFPKQLNTSIQAALYVGLRNDYFRMGYNRTPLGNYKRHFNHFGFSLGLFSGFGSTVMNESVTLGQVEYEYEGVVFVNGIAGIVGVNNFTLGLAVGIDHLLDQNREVWIYQQKPWVGLAFGLNLN